MFALIYSVFSCLCFCYIYVSLFAIFVRERCRRSELQWQFHYLRRELQRAGCLLWLRTGNTVLSKLATLNRVSFALVYTYC